MDHKTLKRQNPYIKIVRELQTQNSRRARMHQTEAAIEREVKLWDFDKTDRVIPARRLDIGLLPTIPSLLFHMTEAKKR